MKPKNPKTIGSLKMLYFRKKHYRSRGLWSRTNYALYKVLKTEGHDAWVKAVRSL